MELTFERVLLDYGAHEVSPMELYADIFDLGNHAIERTGELEHTGKANPIILGKNGDKVVREIMLEDTFEEQLTRFQAMDWAVLNGLTYWGRANKAANQAYMRAFVFDVDDLVPDDLMRILPAMASRTIWGLLPNYIALSGHHLHYYYVLDEPVCLFPNAKVAMKSLKYAYNLRLYASFAPRGYKVQQQGINQGFRIAGGRTKLDGVRVRVFKVYDHPYTVEDFLKHIGEDRAAPIRETFDQAYPEAKLTLEQAKELHPDWYASRIEHDNSKLNRWHVKRDLYDWWLKQKSKARFHGRYFYVMNLAIYAMKCDVPFEEVQQTAYDLIPFLDSIETTKPDPFTKEDVDSALEAYDERFLTFPRDTMAKNSLIDMPVNKRNGRTRTAHMKRLNRIISGDVENGEPDPRYRGGAPTKKQLIQDYAANHPGYSNRRIAAALGVSRNTVNKWLNPCRESRSK